MIKAIPHNSRYEPAFEAELDELFDDIRFLPFHNNHAVSFGPGWLLLSVTFAADTPTHRRGWFHVHMTQALAEMMDSRSIFDASLEHAHKEHFLEMVPRRDETVLFMRFSRILGSYALTRVDPLKLAVLLNGAIRKYEEN